MPLLALFQATMKTDRVEAESDARRFRLKATGGNFLTAILGISPRASLTADAHGFRLQKTTFGSEENTYIPRNKIASTVSVVVSPVQYLIAGIMNLFVAGLMLLMLAFTKADVTVPLVMFGLIGVVFIILYFVSNRRVVIGVISTGGTGEVVKLKANENQLADIREGMKILEGLIRDDSVPAAPSLPDDREEDAPPPRRPAAVAAPSRGKFTPTPPPPPPPAADETSIITCPSCGTRMSIPSSAAGRKVRCTSCREVFTATV